MKGDFVRGLIYAICVLFLGLLAYVIAQIFSGHQAASHDTRVTPIDVFKLPDTGPIETFCDGPNKVYVLDNTVAVAANDARCS